MKSFAELGALPPNPWDLPLFFRQKGRRFAGKLEGGIGCRPVPFRPLNRSLGLLPSIALSRPAQVASVCIRQLRRSTKKRLTVTTNPDNSSYAW